MTVVGARRIRVATLNCRQVGWTADTGQHEVDPVVTAVDELGPAPHILCLTGTADLRLNSSATLLALTQRLGELLPDDDFYYSFVSERPGSRDSSGLWLSARHVHVVADHKMPHPGDPRPSREVYHHTVEALIANHHVWLKAVHWRDPDSPEGSIIQSAIDSQLAAVPALLLGDFGTSLIGDETPGSDWVERRTNTDALERVLRAGFWDAGQIANPPAGHALARILTSCQTPAHLVPGSYVLGPDVAGIGSAHAGAACDLDFGTPTEPERDEGERCTT